MTGKKYPKTPGKVNVAAVGLGFMGVTHLRAYLETEAARIVAGNIKKSDDINLGPQVNVYRKLEELLADPDVELVDLCTPTPLHPEQAIAALRADKYVLCEKPLARTAAAAREIAAVAEASLGFLMPAMCMRFWPG